MAGTPKEFKADLRRFNKKVEDVLVVVHKETTLAVRFAVANRTPILTGRASGSWNASAGTPNFIPKPEGYLNPGGAPYDGDVNLAGLQLGGITHVANGVPYIGGLNTGSSLKAPAGFVEATALDIEGLAPVIVRNSRRKVRV